MRRPDFYHTKGVSSYTEITTHRVRLSLLLMNGVKVKCLQISRNYDRVNHTPKRTQM